MKKFFMQLRQWILKYKKKLIYGALALFIGQICFFGLGGIGVQNEVFAEEGNVQSTEFQGRVSKWYQSISFFQNIVYVLIYPVLVLAGKLVDNSFIYGEVFGFDTVLWDLWNMIRNMANFALGFIFIFYIFKYIIKQDSKQGPKWLIVRALIAGVGIQASWFIMAALVDISTILTYGVGGLPVYVLGNNDTENSYNPYVLKTLISVGDLDNTVGLYLTEVSTGDTHSYISECETFKYGGSGDLKEELILAPKHVSYRDESNGTTVYHHTDKYRCHYFGQVYYFKDGVLYEELNHGDFFECEDNITCSGAQNDFSTAISNAKVNLLSKTGSEISSYINDGKILQIGDAHADGGIWRSQIWSGRYTANEVGLDVDNKWTGSGKTSKLNDVLDGKSYVGVFTSLYSSLMNAGMGMVSSGGSLYTKFLNIALSFFHMLAIALPLIAMCVVFLIRIAILWMAIALAPFIVLLTAFDLWGSDTLKSMKTLEYFNPKNLLWIIFSPAVMCFAVSMSTVLVKVIETLNTKDIAVKPMEIFGGLIHINLEGFGIQLGRFIIAVMGVAITWFLIRWAIKLSKIGESKVVQGIEGFMKTSIESVPIVPIPGKNGAVSIGAIKSTVQKAKDNLNDYTSDTKAIENLLNPKEQKAEGLSHKYERYSEGFDNRTIGEIAGAGDWMNMEVSTKEGKQITFHDLDTDHQKAIVQKINAMEDKEKRKAFGKNQRVYVGDETYIFRGAVKVIGPDKKETSIEINKYLTEKEFNTYLQENKYSLSSKGN